MVCWVCSISPGNSLQLCDKHGVPRRLGGAGSQQLVALERRWVFKSCFSSGKGWIQLAKFQVSTTFYSSLQRGISPCQEQICFSSWGSERADGNSASLEPRDPDAQRGAVHFSTWGGGGKEQRSALSLEGLRLCCLAGIFRQKNHLRGVRLALPSNTP